MHDDDVRDLLGRAGDGIPGAGGSAEQTVVRARRDRRLRRVSQVGAVAIAAAAVVLGGLLWPGSAGTPDAGPADASLTVPDVVGLWRPDAEAALESAGLEVAVRTVTPAEQTGARPGTVLDQVPDSGTEVPAGSTVHLSVEAFLAGALACDGNVSEGIYDVFGDPEGPSAPLVAAERSVRLGAGETLRLDSHERSSAAVSVLRADGTVRAELGLQRGSRGWYLVSDRRCAGEQTTAVPDITDLTERDAVEVLEQVGLGVTVGMVSTDDHPGVAQGTVVEQDPSAGEVVEAGTTVDVLVVRPISVPPPGPTVDPSLDCSAGTLEGSFFPGGAGATSALAAARGYADAEKGETVVITEESPRQARGFVLGADGTAQTRLGLARLRGWHVTSTVSCSEPAPDD